MVGRLSSWLKNSWLGGTILVLGVMLVYLPTLWADFVWDDGFHILNNPYIVGPLGLIDIWTTRDGLLFPLSQSMFWLEHTLWSVHPMPYHLVNVVEQAACTVLLWRVFLSLRVPGAWLGAALWAFHPLQVESVAWISEMKNTLSCLFYLLAALYFLRWIDNRGKAVRDRWSYALTLIFAALAMASKSSTAVLPAVLALSAWWVEGRWNSRNLRILIPTFLLSLLAITVTLWPPAPDMVSIIGQQGAQTWTERIATAGDVIWFYLYKLIWPHPLMVIYPRWEIDGGQILSFLPLFFALVALFIFWFERNSWARACFFAFFITSSPSLHSSVWLMRIFGATPSFRITFNTLPQWDRSRSPLQAWPVFRNASFHNVPGCKWPWAPPCFYLSAWSVGNEHGPTKTKRPCGPTKSRKIRTHGWLSIISGSPSFAMEISTKESTT